MDLKNFPVVIDPTTLTIETRAVVSRSSDTKSKVENHLVLHRVTVRPDRVEFPVDRFCVHYFGTSPDLPECTFLLIYDSCGIWRYYSMKDATGWSIAKVPEELNGAALAIPSIRLEFEAPQECVIFHQLLTKYLNEPESIYSVQEELLRLLATATGVYILPVARHRDPI